MAELSFEKRLNSLPSVLTPDTVYLIQTANGLEIYVSDANGRYALKCDGGGSGSGSGGNYRQLTTPKIPIIDNKIALPSIPAGDITHNVMLVYNDVLDPDTNAMVTLVTEYDGITVVHDTSGTHAMLNETETISGYGVVSYLMRT
jgi:hypothetical protein